MTKYATYRQHTRLEIMTSLGVTDKGGAWFTGHVRNAGEHYIFCNIQSDGRTGHNYDNYFDGKHLVWHTREGAKLSNGVIADLVSNSSPVHIFFRTDNRHPFSYHGPATAINFSQGKSVEVRWSFEEDTSIPEELPNTGTVTEGAKRQITVNAYERDPTARDRCIKRWGSTCIICGFDFEAKYGERGRGYIHVHHLVPISTVGEQYQLNPEEDLRPVCPNCHAMLHRGNSEPISLENLKGLMR